MKKNKTLRAAAVLAVGALLSTCLVSGTFAKYTTNAASSDTARVAKWGVTVSPADNSAFQTNYTTDDETATYEGTYSVTSSNKENVVALGTKGELTTVKLSGKPEVAVRVTNSANVALTGWSVDNDYYCPLEVTVGETTLKGTDAKYSSVADFENAIKAAIEAYKADYKPGTDLSSEKAACPVVTWKWAFEGNDDTKDTKLGDAATPAKVNIQITTTVTQVD